MSHLRFHVTATDRTEHGRVRRPALHPTIGAWRRAASGSGSCIFREDHPGAAAAAADVTDDEASKEL
jgi:hypothetical protein